MRDQRPEDCRFRLSDEGKPYMTPWCPACEQTAVVTPGARCHLDVRDVDPRGYEALHAEVEKLSERLQASEARTVLLEGERATLLAEVEQLRVEVAALRGEPGPDDGAGRFGGRSIDLASYRERVEAYRQAALASLRQADTSNHSLGYDGNSGVSQLF